MDDDDEEDHAGAAGHIGGARGQRWPRDRAVHGNGGVGQNTEGESERGRGSEWVLGFTKGSMRLLSPQGTGGWPTRGGSTPWTLCVRPQSSL